MKKIIVVVGATASGKSKLAFKLAQDLSAEIIVCDAYQIYQELNAGVNKPSYEKRKQIKHHLINHISIQEEWNVFLFQKTVHNLIANNTNKLFILEGGSNLYIDSLLKNYVFKKLNPLSDYDQLTNLTLFNKLQLLDSAEAQKIPINNRRRIIQALRIIDANQKPKSVLDQQNNPPLYDSFVIWKQLKRSELYHKINLRVIQMLAYDWINEVKKLVQQNQDIQNKIAFKALGYWEIYEAICHQKPVNTTKIQQKTRNYAKRQISWIKNKFKTNYYYQNDFQYNDLLKQIRFFLNG